MKIVITAAGASNRFKIAGYEQPKFMLPLGDISILESVLNMFDVSDQFLVIITVLMESEQEDYISEIKKKYKNLTFFGIESHQFGPCYSIKHEYVESWIAHEPFIVSYCDFYVSWDYSKYKAFLEFSDPDLNLVTFKDFQPATRGKTLFAYCRTSNADVLEIKEKESFTNNRQDEFASTGIYYFKNWNTFIDCVESSASDFLKLGEQYVSLIFNAAILKKLKVNHFQASKFICLGTPEDYHEYLHWLTFFERLERSSGSSPTFSMTKLMPMSGLGERFKKIGIKVPKPFIPIRNTPMFIHSINSNPRASRNLVVVKNEMSHRTDDAARLSGVDLDIVALDFDTAGPGETILETKNVVDLDLPVLILSCDYENQIDVNRFVKLIEGSKYSAGVFYSNYSRYRMKDPSAFAYAKVDESGTVLEIVEKKVLSDSPDKDALLVGTFWFKTGKLLFEALETAKKNGRLINGELYVANAMNILIENKLSVFAMPVDFWISYGDPEELEIYNWWEELLLNP